MKKIQNETLIDTLKWRYAVKKFDAAKKVSTADWKTLEDSLILTPSSFGLQPWKFLIIQSAEVKKKLTPLSWKQTQVEDCSHFVVFAALNKLTENYITHFINETASQRAMDPAKLEGYKKMMIGDLIHGGRSKIIHEWAIRQVYIALGNLMTSAALLGIDTCPMEGIEPVKYDEVLGLAGSDYLTAVACAVGYRSNEDKYATAKKIRYASSQLVQHI
jgi:nitroreductase